MSFRGIRHEAKPGVCIALIQDNHSFIPAARCACSTWCRSPADCLCAASYIQITMLICMHIVLCTVYPLHTQSLHISYVMPPLSLRYWPAGTGWSCIDGVNVRGTQLQSVIGSSQSDCRQRCEANPSCNFFVLYTNNVCSLRKDFVTGGNVGSVGTNAVDSSANVTCLVRSDGESYV